MITRVQLLEGLPQKFPRAKKTSKFWSDFWQLSTFIANISGTDRHIEHLKKDFINHYPFHVGRKKTGELWSTNKKVLMAHSDQPKWTFSGDYISAITRCCHLKFLHAIQTDPCYLAHLPTGMGVPPPKKIIRVNLQFGLKLSV